MQLRRLVLLSVLGCMYACRSEAPKSTAPQPTPSQEKEVPGMKGLGPLPAYQRKLSGILHGVRGNAEVELALLVIDERNRPQQLLTSSVLTATSKPLAF
ncbi:hypothetical protein D8M37_10405, partial [Corynebacterium pseudodiphtheriticum]